jgi:hypothetical protein
MKSRIRNTLLPGLMRYPKVAVPSSMRGWTQKHKTTPSFCTAQAEAGGHSVLILPWCRAAALAFAVTVSACSTTDYTKPINDFATATGRAQVALSELNAQVSEGYRQVLEKQIVGREVLVQAENENCLESSHRCRLMMFDKNKKSLGHYPPELPLQRMPVVMAQINAYAANLKALVEADTANKVEGQVNAALASVQKLAETVATTGGNSTHTIPQFATPVGQALNWLIGQYVERVKLKGLQHATSNAKPVVQAAAKLFATTSVFASDTVKSDLAEEVSTAISDIRQSANESNLNKLVQRTGKYDALLVSTPPRLFDRMREAHDGLADNLQGEGITFVTALARIEAFAAEAARVAKILEDLRAITTDKKGK